MAEGQFVVRKKLKLSRCFFYRHKNAFQHHLLPGLTLILIFKNKLCHLFLLTLPNINETDTMKTNDEIISDLKGLVNILNDGKQGYESAAETTDSLELKAHIKVHGGNADDNDNGGVLGAVHRTWIDIKQAFAGNENKAILDSIITGEKAAIEKYDAYIADYTDHADHLTLLKKQRDGIQEDLNGIQSLKLQYS